jgi:single-stranded-DNA-specific exonuclease
MDAAAARSDAVRGGETIGVFGDYDVDGATSSALLKRFFEAAGGKVEIYIPDRIVEGYGPNLPGLQALQRRGARVVITVDCGITAFAPLEEAAREGIEVIVVDHHVAEPRLPVARAVVSEPADDDAAGAARGGRVTY